MKAIAITLVGAALAAYVVATQQTQLASLKVGEAAPNFTLTDSEGKSQELSAYKGKFVVLEWTNKDCPYVKKHYESGSMQATQKEAKEMGAVWLSIISSAPGKEGYMDAADINAYRKDHKVAAKATLLDSNGKVGRLYGARTTPQIVIVNPEGNVIYEGAIDDQPSPDPDTLKGAKNYVLSALKEAMAGKPVTTPVSRPYGCGVKY